MKKHLKKIVSLLSVAMVFTLLTACGSNDNASNNSSASADNGNVIEDLKIQFVPSRDPEAIVTQTEPLGEILTAQLAEEGYEVKNVDISVGTNFEATGEALTAGTVDIGFIPGGTYVLYDDGVEPILTATRKGLSIDSDNPVDWNENKPTERSDEQADFYRALIVAGPSEKGQELAAKVNNGEELTWEDIESSKWSVMSTTSPAGYIYPYLWLEDHFEKGLTDIPTSVKADSYASAFARLASGQVDVLCTYADARLDYEDKWQTEFERDASIWDETNLIGVTDKVYNDTISVSKNSKIMTPEFKEALINAFIKIGESEEGKEIISIYSHDGYVKADPANYDGERAAQKLLKELNK